MDDITNEIVNKIVRMHKDGANMSEICANVYDKHKWTMNRIASEIAKSEIKFTIERTELVETSIVIPSKMNYMFNINTKLKL
jgi:hypothetical protein